MGEFDFDKNKSRANLAKHGIDFEAAQELWQDPDLLKIQAKTEGEPRFLMIGRIGAKHWSAVVAYREERIRLISFRRARGREVELYER
jgi:hypothetical protein